VGEHDNEVVLNGRGEIWRAGARLRGKRRPSAAKELFNRTNFRHSHDPFAVAGRSHWSINGLVSKPIE